MKLAKLADGRSGEDRKYLGQLTMELRKVINDRKGK
jgi:cation transport regulator ChaC